MMPILIITALSTALFWGNTALSQQNSPEIQLLVRGDEWFMGSNNDWTPRELKVSLDFLVKGDFVAEIYADGPNAATDANDAVFSRVLVNAGDTLSINMAPGGGQVVRFYPIKDEADLPRYNME